MPTQVHTFPTVLASRKEVRERGLIEAKEKRRESALEALKTKPVLCGMDVQIFRYKITSLFKVADKEHRRRKSDISELEKFAEKLFLENFADLTDISFNLKESRIIAFKKQITGCYKLTYKEKSFTFGV